jgi:hypothetical protein
MLQIGLNENVFLEKVIIDEKNNIEITFSEIASKEKKTVSHFEALASDDITESSFGMGIKLFPATPSPKTDVTEEKKLALIDSDLNRTKGIIRHILLQYKSAADLAGLWKDVFMGVAISAENYPHQIKQPAVLEAVHKSMGRIFLENITPFLNRRELAMRLLLVRQSKDKHYATFRGKYLDENPFLESMEIPLSASKLATMIDPKDPAKGYGPKWTKYELEQGLTHGVPIEKKADEKTGTGASGSTTTPSAQAPQTAASIFGTQ